MYNILYIKNVVHILCAPTPISPKHCLSVINPHVIVKSSQASILYF